jgi:hypothetical protein
MALGAGLATASASAGPVIGPGGLLAGFDNIVADGRVFNVRFIEGQCYKMMAPGSNHGECDFARFDSLDVQTAFDALRNSFEAYNPYLMPVMVNGCGDPLDHAWLGACTIYMPQEVSGSTADFKVGVASFSLGSSQPGVASNQYASQAATSPIGTNYFLDTADAMYGSTFARWTEVPEPGSLACAALALGLLAWRRQGTRPQPLTA